MDKVVRRAIFSKDKKIFGYFYFVGKSPFDHQGDKGSVLGIMRELMYDDNDKDDKMIFARIGNKDLINDVYKVLPKENTVMDISDIIDDDRYLQILDEGFKTMLYVEHLEDVQNFKNVTYIRCGVNNADFDRIVKEVRENKQKLIICGINSEALFCKAERYNPDCYEGSAVATQVAQVKISDLYLDSTITRLTSVLKGSKDIPEIVNIIKTDSKVAAYILGVANKKEILQGENKVGTVESAVVKIGADRLYFVVDLISQGRTTDNIFTDVIKKDLFRAEFCDSLNNVIKNGVFGTQKHHKLVGEDAYMIGLFSDLDVLMNKSMKDAVRNLGQSENVLDALLYKDGIGGVLLNLVTAYEDGAVEKMKKFAESIGLKYGRLESAYYTALTNTNKLWQQVHG